MQINFSFQAATSLRRRKALKSFIGQVFMLEGVSAKQLSIVFCDDEFLLQINRDYLNHNYYTDIITFNLSELGAPGLSGEIYISVDTVRSNAAIYKIPFQHELFRVIFHGVLHLCGYKDKNKHDKALMKKMEDKYLLMYTSAY